MTYIFCKRVIENSVYDTQEKYDNMMIKLDVFLLNNRISDTEYNELVGMLSDKFNTQ